MRMLSVVVLGVFAAIPSFGAEPKDARLEAMAAVPDLVGKWEGSGWIRMGPGDPAPFVGEETVEGRLGGRVLIIEGKHYAPDRSAVVHHALAMLSFDTKTGEYRFDTALENRDGGSFRARVENGALIWEMASPERPSRFTIRVEDDTWHEVGEVRIEGVWRKFFEMNLKRVK